MKRLHIGLFILIVCVLITGCATATQTTKTSTPAITSKTSTTATTQTLQPQSGGTLKIISRTAVTQFSCPITQTTGIQSIGMPTFEYLVMQNQDFSIAPGLAESWDVAADGKSITLHLRKGVKFLDGTDFNAAAVKYNLDNQAVTTYLRNVSSTEVIDDYTLRINLKNFDSMLLNQMAQRNFGMMASPTAAKISKDQIVGTGPFKFVSWQRDVSINYQKNDSYWQKGKPYLDGLQFLLISDPQTSIMAFQAKEGQVLTGVTPKEASDLQAKGYDILQGNQGVITQWMTPDGNNPSSPFADQRVRQALEYAIDKNAIAKAIGGDYYKAAYEWAMPTDLGYNTALQPREYDPTKAKQLLASAGYPNGFDTSLIALNTANQDMLVMIQTYLKAVNINAALTLKDSASLTDIQKNGWTNGIAFPAVGGIIGFLLGLQTQFTSPASGGTLNHSMFWPADWQAKLDAAIADPNDAKRLQEYRDLLKESYDNVMAIPIFGYMSALTAVDKSVHDLGWGLNQSSYFQPANVWLSK